MFCERACLLLSFQTPLSTQPAGAQSASTEKRATASASTGSASEEHAAGKAPEFAMPSSTRRPPRAPGISVCCGSYPSFEILDELDQAFYSLRNDFVDIKRGVTNLHCGGHVETISGRLIRACRVFISFLDELKRLVGPRWHVEVPFLDLVVTSQVIRQCAGQLACYRIPNVTGPADDRNVCMSGFLLRSVTVMRATERESACCEKHVKFIIARINRYRPALRRTVIEPLHACKYVYNNGLRPYYM